MPVFGCFFFADDGIVYWENIDSPKGSIAGVLKAYLADGEWDAAEAWLDDELVFRLERSSFKQESFGAA